MYVQPYKERWYRPSTVRTRKPTLATNRGPYLAHVASRFLPTKRFSHISRSLFRHYSSQFFCLCQLSSSLSKRNKALTMVHLLYSKRGRAISTISLSKVVLILWQSHCQTSAHNRHSDPSSLMWMMTPIKVNPARKWPTRHNVDDGSLGSPCKSLR